MRLLLSCLGRTSIRAVTWPQSGLPVTRPPLRSFAPSTDRVRNRHISVVTRLKPDPRPVFKPVSSFCYAAIQNTSCSNFSARAKSKTGALRPYHQRLRSRRNCRKWPPVRHLPRQRHRLSWPPRRRCHPLRPKPQALPRLHRTCPLPCPRPLQPCRKWFRPRSTSPLTRCRPRPHPPRHKRPRPYPTPEPLSSTPYLF